MLASEMTSTDWLKAAIFGDSGTGKTCLAIQAPKPMEYWDFDGKVNSGIRFMKEIGKEKELDQIEVHQFGKLPRDKRILEFEKRLKHYDSLKMTDAKLPATTIVLDSISTLSYFLMDDYIHRSQRGLKRPLPDINCLQDYQLYEKHMTQMLLALLSLDCHFIVLGHIDNDKDETTGAIVRKPLASGRQLAMKLPIWFEEVYVAKVMNDGKRVLQTHPKGGFMARTQRGLKEEIPMNMSEVIK